MKTQAVALILAAGESELASKVNKCRDKQRAINLLTDAVSKRGWRYNLLHAPLALLSPVRTIQTDPILHYLDFAGYARLSDLTGEYFQNKNIDGLRRVCAVLRSDPTPFLKGIVTLINWVAIRMEEV